MNRTIKDSRVYGGINDVDMFGKVHKQFTVEYTISFNKDGRIEDIRNQNGYLIERKSECFDYFRSKYE